MLVQEICLYCWQLCCYFFSLEEAWKNCYIHGNCKPCYQSKDVNTFLDRTLDDSDYSPTNNREFCARYRMNTIFGNSQQNKKLQSFPPRYKRQKVGKSEHQFLFYLALICKEGCSASNWKATNQFSPTWFNLYKDRCTAAILDLEQEAYFWPNISEKKAIEKFLINMQYLGLIVLELPTAHCFFLCFNRKGRTIQTLKVQREIIPLPVWLWNEEQSQSQSQS